MDLIDEILVELKAKYGFTKFEIEKVISSQFKVLANTIQNKETKIVNIMYLGKFKPREYLLKRRDENKNNTNRLEERDIQKEEDRGTSKEAPSSM